MLTKIVASSVLIIGILVIRAFFQKKINPIFIYALWLPVALRLLMPGMLFFSPVSIMNTNLWRTGSALLSEEEDRQDREYKEQRYQAYYEQKILEVQRMAEQRMAEQGSGKEEMEEFSGSPVESGRTESSHAESAWTILKQTQESQITGQGDSSHENVADVELNLQWSGTLFGRLRQFAGIVWMAGMGITALIFLWQNLSFYHYLRSVRREFTKAETGRRKLSVFMAGDKLASPCLFGIVPAVYIPEGSMKAEDEQQLTFVLEHELTHYRHGDHIWAFVRILCLVINWYNPLAWLGAKLSMQDGELACDAGCINRLGESKRCTYGEALLTMVKTSGEREKPLKAATMMTSGKKFMKKRIERIVEGKKNSLLALAVMVGFALLAAGCTCTGTSRIEEMKSNQTSASAETNAVLADKAEAGDETENETDDGSTDGRAAEDVENDKMLYSGKAVVIKGEGEGLNGNLQGIVFLILPGPDKTRSNEKEVVLLPGDLYMPDLYGNGVVLTNICREYTSQEILEMLNRNLELSLEEIEVWGYETLIRKVDNAGGINIDVEEGEIAHINNYQLMMTGNGNFSENEVTQSGIQTLSGIQAAAYLQLRYFPPGFSQLMGRWEQVILALLEKENLEVISCQESYFSRFGQSVYVESMPKSYLLCLEWEKEIEKFHEDFYPEQPYHASDYVKETDQMMREQAESAVQEARKEASRISYLFGQYMGQNPFMISLITGIRLDTETEDAWRQAKVWVSQASLVVDEKLGKAVYEVSLVFDDAGTLDFPEYTQENPVSVQRFLYMTKKGDGWYVDGLLHNDLPSVEWWEDKMQEWEICEFGFSDKDAEGILTKSQDEYDLFIDRAQKAAKDREKIVY